MECDCKKKCTLGVLILVALAILAFGYKTMRWSSIKPDQNLYQVVLLTNDQVFYGKLHELDTAYPYLTDVYYLNAQKPDEKAADQSPKYTVVKRGIDEIHAPADRMYFQKTNILYWENVGPESNVAKGIRGDKEWRAKQGAQPVPAPVPAR